MPNPPFFAPNPAEVTVQEFGFGTVLLFMARYTARYKFAFILLAAVVVIAAMCAVAAQFQMKRLVDAMSLGPLHSGEVWRALLIFVGLIGFETLCWRLASRVTCRTTINAGVAIRLDLFNYVSRLPAKFFSGHLSGSLGQRLTGAAGAFGAAVNITAWRFVPPCVDFAGTLIIFAMINAQMAVMLGAFVVIAVSVLVHRGLQGQGAHTAYFRDANVVAGDLIDVVSNIWAVRAFSARRHELRRMERQFEREAHLQRKSWLSNENTRLSYDIALWLMAGAVFGWAVSLWSVRLLTPGDVVVISALTFRILHGSRDFSIALLDLNQQWAYLEETLQVLGSDAPMLDAPDVKSMARSGGALRMINVSFWHTPGLVTLDGIDLRVRAGEKVGIVGSSGAGKTTLIQLIQRVHEIRGGEILIDGQSVAAVSLDRLHAAMAVVPQEVVLFHRSVRENICYGRPDATDTEMWVAASIAKCHDFISILPQGYDTPIGERGVRLSGGQRQRIGLARAILKNSPILILDEATSSLDSETERQIHEGLVDHLRGRTVLAVAHRLSSLTAFDRIVVIDAGRIVEEGTPADLKQKDGFFSRMSDLQRGFDEADRSPMHRLSATA